MPASTKRPRSMRRCSSFSRSPGGSSFRIKPMMHQSLTVKFNRSLNSLKAWHRCASTVSPVIALVGLDLTSTTSIFFARSWSSKSTITPRTCFSVRASSSTIQSSPIVPSSTIECFPNSLVVFRPSSSNGVGDWSSREWRSSRRYFSAENFFGCSSAVLNLEREVVELNLLQSSPEANRSQQLPGSDRARAKSWDH